MNGEIQVKILYEQNFTKMLKTKPDSFFHKKNLHKPNGHRGSWTPNIEEKCFQKEKSLRNL